VAALAALAACAAFPALGHAAPLDRAVSARADSSSVFPEKRSSRPAWERVVNAPLKLAYLPVGITLGAGKQAVKLAVEGRVVTRVREFLVSDDGRTGVVPIATPSRGAGAKFFHRGWFSPNSRFSAHARAATHSRQDYGVELERVVLFDGSVSLGGFVGYEFNADEHFFGIGMDNDPDADESDFTHELARAEVRLGKLVGEQFHVASVLGVEHNNILEGREPGEASTNNEYASAELPGAGDARVRFVRAEVAGEYDTRDSGGTPARGVLVTAGGAYFAQLQDDRYGFWKARADVRGYVDLFYRRVLMLRAAAESTERVSGREVPFYHLSELGRHGSIRGFSTGRFRGMDAVAASVEYSWPVARKCDFLLFADAGQVFSGFDNVDLDAVEVGWGGGFRVHGHDRETVRFEFGKSRDEWRLYFSLN
jgi:outer membrane protein assembly factor BamA